MRFMSASQHTSVCLALLLLMGCADVATAPTPAHVGALRVVTFPQMTIANREIDPIRVQLLDEHGLPLLTSGVRVVIAVAGEPGATPSIAGALTATTVNGVATFTGNKFGKSAKSIRLVATAEGFESGSSPPFSVTPEPVMLDSVRYPLIGDSASRAAGYLEFVDNGSPALDSGTVVVGRYAGGFMRRTVFMTRLPGRTRYFTEAVSLDQVIQRDSARVVVGAAAGTSRGSFVSAAAGVSSASDIITAQDVLLYGSATEGVTLRSGTFNLKPSMIVDGSWGVFSISRLQLKATAATTFSATIESNLTAGIAYSGTKLLGIYVQPFEIPAGPIVIPAVFTFPITLEWSVDLAGKTNATVTTSGAAEVTAGFDWSREKGFVDLTNASFDVTPAITTTSNELSLIMQLGVRGRPSVNVAGLASGTLDLQPYVRFSHQADLKNFTWTNSCRSAVSVNVDLTLSAFALELGAYRRQATLLESEWPICRKSGTIPGPIIRPSPETLDFLSMGSKPQTLTVDVTNSGAGTLDGLLVGEVYGSSASGWLNAVFDKTTAPAKLSVTATPAGLSPGIYLANLLISSTAPGVSRTPVTVGVTMTVMPNVLSFTSQPGTAVVGAVLAPPITVEAHDPDGKLISTFAGDVTIALDANAAVASLGGTLTRRAVNGVATFGDLSVSKAGSGYSLKASASGLTTSTSGTFDVITAPVGGTKLGFTVSPSTAVQGLPINPAIVVQAQDAAGNPLLTYTGDITIAFDANPAGATLGGTLTRKAVNGSATFTDLTISKSGTGFSFKASATGATPSTSSTFAVTATQVVATKLMFSVQPSQVAQGQAIAPAVVVQAQDASGNLASTFAGTITIAFDANPAGATLGGTLSRTAVNGSATFPDLTVSNSGSGFSLKALATGLTVSTSSAFNVTSTQIVASKLVFSVQPSNATQGQAIAPAVVVQVQDAFGNLASTYTGAITISFGANPNGATLGGTLTRTAANGSATFPDLSVSQSGNAFSLKATASGLTPSTSGTFNVTATAPAAPTNAAATADWPLVKITWTNNSSSQTSLTLERATNAGGPWTVVSSTIPPSSTLATEAPGSGTFWYRVKACIGASCSAYSTTPSVSLAAPTDVLVNGGFESGPAGWAFTGDAGATTTLPNARTGVGYGFLGTTSDGTAKNSAVGAIYQGFSVPAGKTATLTFAYFITTQETTNSAFDFLNVTLQTSSGQFLAALGNVLSNMDKKTGYTSVSFDISAYAGQSLRVNFLATNDSSKPTTFRIDDVSVVVR